MKDFGGADGLNCAHTPHFGRVSQAPSAQWLAGSVQQECQGKCREHETASGRVWGAAGMRMHEKVCLGMKGAGMGKGMAKVGCGQVGCSPGDSYTEEQ